MLRPTLSPEEVEQAKQTVGFELQTLAMRPEQEPLLMDMIHAVSVTNRFEPLLKQSMYVRTYPSYRRSVSRRLSYYLIGLRP